MKPFETRSISVISMVRPRKKPLGSLLLWWIHRYFKKHFSFGCT